jgi:uncharacterized repeat protein (TIGR01451 family)
MNLQNSSSRLRTLAGRRFAAFLLCCTGSCLGILSFAVSSLNSSSVAPPGFHAAVTAAGSNGGSESYTGIPFVGPRTGNRVLAWQAGAKYNISPDGVNWNFTSGQVPGNSGGGDVSTAVDAFGAYYIMEFCSTTQGELQACLHKSADGGATWTTTTIANVAPNPIDRPWVEVYPKLAPTASITSTSQTHVYLEYHTFTDGQTYLNTSTDGGATFGPPIPASVGTNSAIPDSNCNTVPSGIAVDQSNGTVYALWLSADDIAQDIMTGCNITQIGPYNKAWVTKSTDGGTTWMIPSTGPAWTGFYDPTTDTGDNANKIFGSVAVDYAGQVHVLLTVRKKDQPLQYVVGCENPQSSCVEAKADTDLVLVTSPDGGAHWTAPRDVNLVHDTDNNPDTNPHSYFYVWSFGGAKGMVDAIYYFAPTNRPNDTSATTNSWVTKFSQISDAIANPPGVGGCPAQGTVPIPPAPACYVGAGPQVAESQVSNAVIHVGQICTFGIFCDLVTGGDRSLLDSNNITIDPAGGANATWTANANPSNERVEFVCQNAGRSLFDGANAPEPFAGGSPILNGCYGPTDMAIAMTGSQNPIAPGGTLTYHLTIINNGAPTMSATTSGVTVTDALPAGVTLVSATPSSGSCSGTSTVTCNLGIFPTGVTATINIVVTMPSTSGVVSNTATVSAATNDPTAGNNSATVTTNVTSIGPTIAVSRKTHGTAGTFDVNLPFTGTPAIECRTGAVAGNHQVVVSFNGPVTVNNVTVSPGPSGTASVTSFTSGSDVTINLDSVSNAQTLTINLLGVSDGSSTANFSVPMSVLLGDVNASARVDAADVSSVRQQTLQTITNANFRNDINASGRIDAADVSVARQQALTSLP